MYMYVHVHVCSVCTVYVDTWRQIYSGQAAIVAFCAVTFWWVLVCLSLLYFTYRWFLFSLPCCYWLEGLLKDILRNKCFISAFKIVHITSTSFPIFSVVPLFFIFFQLICVNFEDYSLWITMCGVWLKLILNRISKKQTVCELVGLGHYIHEGIFK